MAICAMSWRMQGPNNSVIDFKWRRTVLLCFNFCSRDLAIGIKEGWSSNNGSRRALIFFFLLLLFFSHVCLSLVLSTWMKFLFFCLQMLMVWCFYKSGQCWPEVIIYMTLHLLFLTCHRCVVMWCFEIVEEDDINLTRKERMLRWWNWKKWNLPAV